MTLPRQRAVELPDFSDRFRLHRAGIVNVDQFDNQTLEFPGGRGLLRGTNGARKSLTLQMLLPYCLDADVAAMDATGGRRLSLKWLMNDGYPDDNRVGYLWVEFARPLHERSALTGQVEQEYYTAGVHIKSSRTANTAVPTYFTTTRRPGIDLHLISASNQMLPLAELTAQIGSDRISSTAREHRARVAEDLFGLKDDRRYRNLMHLLHELRRPTIGDQIDGNGLTTVLSQALPPLDEELLTTVASNLDDLEAVRETTASLTAVAAALDSFSSSYRGYLSGQIRKRTAALGDTISAYRSSRLKENAAFDAWQGAIEAAEAKAAALSALRQHIAATDAEHRILITSPAYKSLQDLAAHRDAIRALKQAVTMARKNVESSRGSENNHAEQTVRTAEELAGSVAELRRAWTTLVSQISASGCDVSALQTLPTLTINRTAETRESDRCTPDTDRGSEVVRPAVHDVVADVLLALLNTLESNLTAVRDIVAQRRRLVQDLTNRAEDVAKLAQAHSKAVEATAAAQEEVTAALARVTAAADQIIARSHDYATAARSWLDQAPVDFSALADMRAALNRPVPADPGLRDLNVEVSDLAEEPADAEPVGSGPEGLEQALAEAVSAVRALIDPVLQQPAGTTALPMEIHPQVTATLRQHLDPIQQELAGLSGALQTRQRTLERAHTAATRERKQVDSGHEQGPRRAPWRTGTHPGAALYTLVAFHDDVPQTERAAVEAALEAAGLLDATVTDNAELIDPDTRDVILLATAPAIQPQPGSHGSTLAQVLRVEAAQDTSPGLLHAAEQILHTIALTDHPAAHAASDGQAAVGRNGRWRHGLSAGAASKPAAEFLGAGARAARRQRRLAELDQVLADLSDSINDLRTQQTACHTLTGQLTSFSSSAPDTAAQQLVLAYGQQQSAEQALARREKAGADREREEATAARNYDIKKAELAQAGRDAALPTSVGELRELAKGYEQRSGDITALLRSLNAVRSIHDRHRRHHGDLHEANGRRMTAESEMLGELRDYTDACTQLAVLEGSLGASETELRDREQALRDTLTTAKGQEAGVDTQAQQARDAVGKLYHAAADGLNIRRERAEQALLQAADLTAVLALPGVREAAGLEQVAAAQELAGLQVTLADHAELGGGELFARSDRTEAGEYAVIDGALSGHISSISGALGAVSNDISYDALVRRYETLSGEVVKHYDTTLEMRDGIQVVLLADASGTKPVAHVTAEVQEQAALALQTLTDDETKIIRKYLTGDLSEHLSKQLASAESLVTGMNELLTAVRSSHGFGVSLRYQPHPDLDQQGSTIIELLRKGEMRTDADNDMLREALQSKIAQARLANPEGGYLSHLRTALNYRDWFTFVVRVIGTDGTDRALNRKIGLSEGEKRVVSYLPLFAAAAAYFTSLADAAPHSPRLILLDDAFAKVDEPTHGRLLGLLEELQLDYLLTSERLWGTFQQVSSLGIYEVLRDASLRGVAMLHYTWDGARKIRVVA